MKGQNLYLKAKKIIPGGNMLLSKRPEMFLPNLWPSYFSQTKDCYVWDLDNNKYTDLSHMGVGTNSLGYSNQNVDNMVRSVIDKGNMSTLNCPEEVELAERLIELHEWAEMVRFARTGGEANAIAVRIARAASGKDKVAICGYHGWHDWYLSANIKNNQNLNNHLLSGLDSTGVPKSLIGTVIPFEYNDIDQIRKIVQDNSDLGAIKMEVVRSTEPKPGYLEEIRRLCDKNNIVLIFDECTSGFRETFGGIHKKYGVTPDMCMFGKALGNGYAITAVIGKREIMESAQTTFISSTFWTERIGPSAAIATLNEMKVNKSWEFNKQQGAKIKKGWESIASNLDFDLNITGIDALATFNIKSKNWLKYKTFITQSMLENKFLAANTVYLSLKHSDKIIDEYFQYLTPIFEKIELFEKDTDTIDKYLKNDICHAGFKRLN
jgi:glutamate-1-semialdehyde aminotransferase